MILSVVLMRAALVIITLAIGWLCSPLPTDAQQAGKVYRIGMFRPAGRPSDPQRLQRFEQILHDLGWIEGQNVIFDYQYGTKEQYTEIAAELVRREVDVILVSSTPRTRAMVQAITTIPVVFVYSIYATNPIRTAIVRTRMPGGVGGGKP